MITWGDIARVQAEQVERAEARDSKQHSLADYGVDESVGDMMHRIDNTLGQAYGAPWLSGLIVGLQLGEERGKGRVFDSEPTATDDEFLAGIDEST